tara:strand:- start:540 stop:677 length:138 start_codon:yes stop_codon:yes gene_type:complete
VPVESEEPEEPPTPSEDEDIIDEAVGDLLPKNDALSVENEAELSY